MNDIHVVGICLAGVSCLLAEQVKQLEGLLAHGGMGERLRASKLVGLDQSAEIIFLRRLWFHIFMLVIWPGVLFNEALGGLLKLIDLGGHACLEFVDDVVWSFLSSLIG